jgi:hypothetical protein
MAKITNMAELTKAIKSIKGRSKSLSASIQDAKNGCLYFFDTNGNVTPVADLLNAVGKGVRYGALKSLFEQAGVKINKDKKTKEWRAKVGKKCSAKRMQELVAANWEDFKHEDETAEADKAKAAFKSALKWLDKYPEVAAEMGILKVDPVAKAA